MYAIIELQGKQYRVSPGTVVRTDKIDAQVGDSIRIEHVLFLHDGKKGLWGEPYLKNVILNGELESHEKGKKVIVATYKRRKGYHRKLHHRQQYSFIKIGSFQKSEK